MKLTLNDIQYDDAWKNTFIETPTYDIEKTREKAIHSPRWIHFGIGNIFRVFIGGIADELLRKGLMDRGITCVETFDYEVVDRIYTPYDNLALSVTLKKDGSRDYTVLASLAEAIKADYRNYEQWNRMKVAFTSPDLQIVSYTITEKGYQLFSTDGSILPYIQKDIDDGPDKCTSAMAITTSMLYERFRNGAIPVALVSMDNCADNGLNLKSSVEFLAQKWKENGYVDEQFLKYLSSAKVSFVCTMIDKITPRPSQKIANDLSAMGIEGMDIIETTKRTYIAPFINAEGPQYLVIDDNFPNGRPRLEEGKGVFMGTYETVRKSERMKVTACLNPVHSATGPLGVVLGYDEFASMLNSNPEILKMARMVAYEEGMPVIEAPGIIAPKAFTDELFNDRFPNEYLGDTNLRLSTDVSQGVGVRFGETLKSYKRLYGSANRLTAIPLGIASWIRYMMGIDDEGTPYTLAPDPMNDEFTSLLDGIKIGAPDSFRNQLKPILSNEKVFFCNLYECGVGEKIEAMFRSMIEGKGAVRKTIHQYMS